MIDFMHFFGLSIDEKEYSIQEHKQNDSGNNFCFK